MGGTGPERKEGGKGKCLGKGAMRCSQSFCPWRSAKKTQNPTYFHTEHPIYENFQPPSCCLGNTLQQALHLLNKEP